MFFLKKNKPNFQAPEYQAYLAHFSKKLDLYKPVSGARFVVLDTETTGLDVKNDRILSLAALEINGANISVKNRLECFVKQDAYQPKESIAVHGILPNQTSQGISEKEMLTALLAFLGNAILVGHHISFDIAIINECMLREMGGPLKNTVLDTGRLARRLEDPFNIKHLNQKEYSLDSLCQKYQIEMGKRHTAAGDAFITALLFLKLLGRLEQKGVKTLKDLLR
ncbi:MAG: 3'-5' exonuclease [Saprospiraceae bacterium]